MKKVILLLSLIIGAETALPFSTVDIGFDKGVVVIDDKVINDNDQMKTAVVRYTNALAANKEVNAKFKRLTLYMTAVGFVLYTATLLSNMISGTSTTSVK